MFGAGERDGSGRAVLVPSMTPAWPPKAPEADSKQRAGRPTAGPFIGLLVLQTSASTISPSPQMSTVLWTSSFLIDQERLNWWGEKDSNLQKPGVTGEICTPYLSIAIDCSPD